jgi:hypothetical protein
MLSETRDVLELRDKPCEMNRGELPIGNESADCELPRLRESIGAIGFIKVNSISFSFWVLL